MTKYLTCPYYSFDKIIDIVDYDKIKELDAFDHHFEIDYELTELSEEKLWEVQINSIVKFLQRYSKGIMKVINNPKTENDWIHKNQNQHLYFHLQSVINDIKIYKTSLKKKMRDDMKPKKTLKLKIKGGKLVKPPLKPKRVFNKGVKIAVREVYFFDDMWKLIYRAVVFEINEFGRKKKMSDCKKKWYYNKKDTGAEETKAGE